MHGTCTGTIFPQPGVYVPQANVLGCCKLVLLPVVYGCALGTITSLIPRPFPPPAFHCLQSANTVGEGLGDLVTCNAIRHTDGRHTVLCPMKNVEVILVLTSEHNGECWNVRKGRRSTVHCSQCPPCVYHLPT